jgi:MFS family permease
MSSTEVGLIASVYLVGEMVGALVFGRVRTSSAASAADHRRLSCTCRHRARASSPAPHRLARFFYARVHRGMGIGGQYAAINSAIDEMMPSKYRGRVDIWINGHLLARRDPRLVRLADLPQRVRRQRRAGGSRS